MLEVLDKYYTKFFENEKSKHQNLCNGFELADAYIGRYNYKITSIEADKKGSLIYIDFDILDNDERYNEMGGFIKLTKNKIEIEIDKVYKNEMFCMQEGLIIDDKHFEGNIVDFAYYDNTVIMFKDNLKYDIEGNTFQTCFNSSGIVDSDGTIIPYTSLDTKALIDEVVDIHNLDIDAAVETFEVDNYDISSVVLHMNNMDMSLEEFEGQMSKRR